MSPLKEDDLIRRIKAISGAVAAALLLGFLGLNAIPVKVEAKTVTEGALYAHEEITHKDIEVTVTSLMGRTTTVEQFEITDADVHNGTVKISLPVGTVQAELEVLPIQTLQTTTKVNTDKPISVADLQVEAVYEDGTKQMLPEEALSSNTIQKPKVGKQTLEVTYKEKSYKLTVNVQPGKAEKLAAEKAAKEKAAREEAARKKAAAEKAAREKAAAEAAAKAKQAQQKKTQSSTAKPASNGNGGYAIQHTSNPLTPSKGVVYYNGHRETYYSQRVLPGGGLKIPGRHVAADGTVRDKDGYICVASSDLAKGTVVSTSLGAGKVYDAGCASGTIDIYTNW